MTAPLEGIRILDLSQGMAGPMASMVLSDNGADVIKIESPNGDPYDGQLGYRAWQRGKRNAIFDLKEAKDLATFKNLVKTVDVVLESFTPDVTTRLGIDYSTLSEINPRLVYCSITGYGRDNPLSHRPAYDALIAAHTGVHFEQRGRVGGVYATSGGEIPFADFEFNPEGIVGPRHEDPDGPMFNAVYWPSVGAAYAAQTAINAALFVREKTGRGQWVETSLMQGALSAATMGLTCADNPDAPHFSTWVNDSRSPKGNFECADGRWIINWVPNPQFVLGASKGDTLDPSPDMAAKDDPSRIMPAVEESLVLDHYYPLMAEAFKRFTADEWVAAGAVAGQCIQKICSPEEGLNDAHFLADGCVAEVEDAKLGSTRQVGTLYHLEKNPSAIKQGVAEPGEDTVAVKAEAQAAVDLKIIADKKGELSRPLEGITVIDLGLAVAGPYCCQVLSDLGADVIKINATYDWYWHSNAIAMTCNRGKRSIAVNLRDPAGVEIIQKLAATADVLVHNMRYKAVEGKGLDYETLKEINPRLVYCHTRGFEKGPREPLPGNDQTGSALSGVQWEDGACNSGAGRPYWSLTSFGDTGNGYLATNGIIQALRIRETTGAGQFVDTSIVNAQLYNCSHIIARNDGTGFERPILREDAFGYSAGYRLYNTDAGYICLAAILPAHWEALFEAIEGPRFAKDKRFASTESRQLNDAALNDFLSTAFLRKTAAEWVELLTRCGVPSEVSNADYSKTVWQDESESFLLERQWLVNWPHPVAGQLGHVGVPYSLSKTPAVPQCGPLIVGEYTREILTDLGYSSEQQAQLFEADVVADESCYGYDIALPQETA